MAPHKYFRLPNVFFGSFDYDHMHVILRFHNKIHVPFWDELKQT
jgi:hypothetical protein